MFVGRQMCRFETLTTFSYPQAEDADRPDSTTSNNNHIVATTATTTAASAASSSSGAAASSTAADVAGSVETAATVVESTTASPTGSRDADDGDDTTDTSNAAASAAAAATAAAATTSTTNGSAVPTISEDDEQPSDAGLPNGWSLQVAPNGRIFFIDHNLRKTSWVDPRTGRASPMPNQGRKPEDDLGALPEGWEERVHSDGRIFFIDHSECG